MLRGIDLKKIREGDIGAFQDFFELYYPKLKASACRFVDEQAAEDLVQDLFISFWERKEQITAENIYSYLHKWIQNRCLNYLKHQSVADKYEYHIASLRITSMNNTLTDNAAEKKLISQDFFRMVDASISKLPPRCSEAFRLCFLHDLPHKEVAKRMNISVRTVESHIRQAIGTLRSSLDPSAIIILIVCSLLVNFF